MIITAQYLHYLIKEETSAVLLEYQLNPQDIQVVKKAAEITARMLQSAAAETAARGATTASTSAVAGRSLGRLIGLGFGVLISLLIPSDIAPEPALPPSIWKIARRTWQQLPPELKKEYTENDVYRLLEKEATRKNQERMGDVLKFPTDRFRKPENQLPDECIDAIGKLAEALIQNHTLQRIVDIRNEACTGRTQFWEDFAKALAGAMRRTAGPGTDLESLVDAAANKLYERLNYRPWSPGTLPAVCEDMDEELLEKAHELLEWQLSSAAKNFARNILEFPGLAKYLHMDIVPCEPLIKFLEKLRNNPMGA